MRRASMLTIFLAKAFLVVANSNTVNIPLNLSTLTFPNEFDVQSVFDTFRDCVIDFKSNPNVNEECAKQMDLSCQNQLMFEFLDASAKFPYTSLLTSNRIDYGNYDQCVGIDTTYDDERIRGRYCMVGLVIPVDTNVDNAYKLGTCTPNKCTAKDMNAFLNKTLNGSLPFEIFQEVGCVTSDKKNFTVEDIVTITIMAVCAGLMTISTIYDVYLNKAKQKTAHPLYLAFSVYTNGKKLLAATKGNKEQIQIFHGIKTISMLWIVAGHNANGWNQYPLFNIKDTDQYTHKFHAFYLVSAYLAVDTFFYLSGFLMAYQYLKQRTKSFGVQVINIPQAIIHRYLRLTPAVLMLYLVSISIFGRIGTGPLYGYAADSIAETCKDRWWPFFLYIQNYYNKDDICLIHTWYLSADMQMYLLGIVVMIPLSIYLKNPKNFTTGMLFLAIFNLILVALPMAIRLHFRDYVNEYDAHSRLMLYFIGVMMGAFMRLKRDVPFFGNKMAKATASMLNIIMWAVVLAGMFATVIMQRKIYADDDQDQETVFDCLKRVAWAAGLSWMVYSSYHGYAGVINWFLTSPIMQVGGKLSYCMYITHGLAVAYNVMVNRSRLYFNDYNIFQQFCCALIWSIILSFAWTLAFESPLITIERFLLGGGRAARKPRPEKNLPENPPVSEHKITVQSSPDNEHGTKVENREHTETPPTEHKTTELPKPPNGDYRITEPIESDNKVSGDDIKLAEQT